MVHICDRVCARGHTWVPYLVPFRITVDLTFWDHISATPASSKLPGSPVSTPVHHHWDYKYALSRPCMPVFNMDAEDSELQSLSCAACSLILDLSPNPSFHDFSVTLCHFILPKCICSDTFSYPKCVLDWMSGNIVVVELYPPDGKITYPQDLPQEHHLDHKIQTVFGWVSVLTELFDLDLM